jgi:hypothetical protein
VCSNGKQIHYPANLVQFNEGSSIVLLVDSAKNAPPYATNIFKAFNLAGLNPTWATNDIYKVYSPTEGHPSAGQLLILIGEKP